MTQDAAITAIHTSSHCCYAGFWEGASYVLASDPALDMVNGAKKSTEQFLIEQ